VAEERRLLVWSDRGVSGPRPAHHRRPRSSDQGPVLRFAEHCGVRYAQAEVLTVPAGEEGARQLAAELGVYAEQVTVRSLPITDPSDHAQIFAAMEPVIAEHAGAAVDILLSSGTPQMQTIVVILVQSGILPARMLKVIPSVYVPVPHPEPVVEVTLNIEGFPQIRALRAEVERLRAEVALGVGTMIGESPPMQLMRRQLARVAAAADVPVLIFGETGTGKELVARAIHLASPRSSGPFIAESCGALAEGVLESELFGHEKGSFTGAAGLRRGLLEQAHGGTLLLDELGEMPARVQVMLLRALQEGRVRRVGGERSVPVDVRVLAATHRDLAEMVRDGTFREDLYYRLCGATLRVPPLRERAGDVERLIVRFLDEAGRLELMPSSATLEALKGYRWPGNVRQLRAEVIRWTVFCDQPPGLAALSPEIQGHTAPTRTASAAVGVRPLKVSVAEVEQVSIRAALDAAGGNRSQAARALEIDRNTLKRKMRAYGIEG
jgi:two-component system response regulator AtoC